MFDPFTTGSPLDLAGTAEHRACGTGALWVFSLAPGSTGVRPQLAELAGSAACGQAPVQAAKKSR